MKESKPRVSIKEINPEHSLEGLMLKLQYFGHLMRRANSLEKTLMLERLKAGGEGGDRGWDGWMASPTQWTWVWASSGRWWRTGKPGVLQSMGLQRVGHNWVTEQQQERKQEAQAQSMWGGREQLGPATDSADCALISTLFLTLRSPILSGCHFPKLLCSKACPGDIVLANQI